MKQNQTNETPLQKLLSWVQTIVMAVVIAVVVNCFLIVNAVIPTGSMISTINIGDRVIANRLAYLFGEVERGDIIIFDAPDEPDMLYVKRVIGLPGDTVVVKDNRVLVNGTALQEPYILEDTRGDWGPYHVPEDSYFCMGDNRNSSADSRYWHNTYVPKDSIKGKVFMRYYSKLTFYKDPVYE